MTAILQFTGRAIQTSVELQELSHITTSGGRETVKGVEISLPSADALPALHRTNLANLTALRALKVDVHFDLGEDVAVYKTLWEAIVQVVSTLPNNIALESFALEGVFPHSLLSHKWATSPVVKTLRRLLHNISSPLVQLIDARKMSAITIKPGVPAVSYTEPEQKRIESLLAAPAAYDMLRF